MFVQHHPCAHHVTSAKCVTCTPNKKVGHGQICQIKENFKFHPAAAFATGLIASQLQDHLFGQASWAQHLPMVLDIRPALRCSSRLSGVGPGNLRSGNLRSSWKMGQPDRRTCRVGTWNCPKDLAKYLRRASNKGFLLVLDASGGQKPWNPWTAARNAATMVEMLPSQHSSFISCQVLHKIKKPATLQSSVPLVSFLEVAVVVFTILVPSPVVLALQIARLRISTEFEQE